MSKKINVKPIETLTIEFEDGESKQAKFSAYAMMILDDEFEGFKKLFESAKEKPFSCGAKLLYAGLKACDEDITIDKAKAIVTKMGVTDILDVFNFAADTFGVSDDLKKTEIPVNRAARRAAKTK
jgi:hypothetical protein